MSLVEVPLGAEIVWSTGGHQVLVRGGVDGWAWNPSAHTWVSVEERQPQQMTGEMVVVLPHASVNAHGGVTTSAGQRLMDSAWATSFDVAQARFPPTVNPVEGSTLGLCDAVLLAQPGDHVFGHQVLDLVPRILTAVNAGLGDRDFLVRAGSAPSLGRLIGDLGLPVVKLVELPEHADVELERLFVVSGARQDERFDSVRLDAILRMWRPAVSELEAAPIDLESGDFGFMWMSRSKLPDSQRLNRLLLNREEFEDELAQSGFQIIHPQELELGDVLTQVAQSVVLGGEDGSALHNALALPEGGALLVIGHGLYPDNIHLRLCDALGLRYFFVGGAAAERPEQREWYPRNRDWALEEVVLTQLRDLISSLTVMVCGDVGRSAQSGDRKTREPEAPAITYGNNVTLGLRPYEGEIAMSDEHVRFIEEVVETIPGWLERFTGAVTMTLLDQQRDLGISGPVMEIGVYGGKYLSVLARSAAQSGEVVLGIDPFIDFTVDQVREHLAPIGHVDLRLVKDYSGSISASDLEALLGGPARFIDVDGSHERDDVLYDLQLCERIIHSRGILAVDDWYNVHDAGVAEAFYRFFSDGRSMLVPFAYVANKLLMSSRPMAPIYKQRVEDLVTRDDTFVQSHRFRERVAVARRMVETNVLGAATLILP